MQIKGFLPPQGRLAGRGEGGGAYPFSTMPLEPARYRWNLLEAAATRWNLLEAMGGIRWNLLKSSKTC